MLLSSLLSTFAFLGSGFLVWNGIDNTQLHPHDFWSSPMPGCSWIASDEYDDVLQLIGNKRQDLGVISF